jgi:hypothetical protein
MHWYAPWISSCKYPIFSDISASTCCFYFLSGQFQKHTIPVILSLLILIYLKNRYTVFLNTSSWLVRWWLGNHSSVRNKHDKWWLGQWIQDHPWLNWSHHFECFMVSTMTWLTVMEYLYHKWSRMCSTCRKHFPVLYSWTPLIDTTLCDKVCLPRATGRWFSPVSSAN